MYIQIMATKQQTSIYLDTDLYQTLCDVAKRRHISISQIIREKMQTTFSRPEPKGGAKQFLDELARLGDSLDWSGTPKNLSENIDHYLYGAPKRPVKQK